MSTPCLPLLSLESPHKTSSDDKLKVLSQPAVCDMSWGLPKPCNSGKIIIAISDAVVPFHIPLALLCQGDFKRGGSILQHPVDF